ncbi:PEP-utilizing enzyme [Bordetella sp. N]|uniref:PEP-utilizing enzyme n=1 Tax=Bordetella sp. N TaxID=1746199 RepID=UPI0007107432|nr:PEP-utilizing enzyme [Bordetella sp. N]ALM82910.1 alpha/beta hydrolase [Bordetella sp. N]
MTDSVLYLLAGNGSAADWWDDVLPCFQHHDVRPLELPGFGDNPLPPCVDLADYARALLSMTERGHAIVAVGVNALLVLHALQLQPGHFSRTVLLAPVGAFLWQRRLPALMAPMPLRRTIHHLLSHWPTLFARKFSRQRWTDEQYRRMGRGYARCRAFVPHWDLVRADTALTLLEWVRDPIELVWGDQDRMLGVTQAAAWSAILARADLTISLQPGWGHYPWIDAPQAFAEWLESGPAAQTRGFVAHTKGGRLRLAAFAGLPVPPALTVTEAADPRLPGLLAEHPEAVWAVRSSSHTEDQADAANAGLHTTYLRVATADVAARIADLRASHVEEAVVQLYVEPVLSGIAFVRHIAVELEWVQGHLEGLADGTATPNRAVLSPLGDAWREGSFINAHGLTQDALWRFLQDVLRTFHYVHGDIEWAWDGRQLWLLQYRPVTGYPWRRNLTSANIGEILPPRPSRLTEYAQRRAAASIPAIMARWDTRVLADNEPFTATFGGASYINSDLFLARMAEWGVSSRGYVAEIGGSAPRLPWRPLRLLRSLPLFLRMQRRARAHLYTLEAGLRRHDDALRALIAQGADGQQLADWFTRFYVFVVQGNLCIATALASSGGDTLGRPPTAYGDLARSPHRVPYEADPASPRPELEELSLQDFPRWSTAIRLAHGAGLPGMRGYYLQVREWYRDNLMRVTFRLHHAMPAADRANWFAPHEDSRDRQGSFWQDGRASTEQADGFMIYPGRVQGTLGEDILLVDTLEPGLYAHYQSARAVIARMGGRLSHGSTLLRELRKPSAVLPLVDPAWLGRVVLYHDGTLTLVEEEGKHAFNPDCP